MKGAFDAYNIFRRVFVLIAACVIFIFCALRVYNWIYGESHAVKRLENLLANGEMTVVQMNKSYKQKSVKIGQSIHFEYTYTYNFVADGKMVEGTYETDMVFPNEELAIQKFLTVHYLKENPTDNVLNIRYEMDRAKKKNNGSVVGLIAGIVGLFISGFMAFAAMVALVQVSKAANKTSAS